jgi:hypothetical protein
MAKIEDAAELGRLVGVARIMEGSAVPACDGAALARTGWTELPLLLSDGEARALADAATRIVAGGLPAVLVYACAETWRVGARVAEAMSASLGAPYELLADAWAFHVAPGASGWSPHRGSYDLGDREAPELLNAWIALTDVPIESSCMHVVPLDRDVHYPTDLRTHDTRASQPLPVRAGAALVWNANVLHWGGASATHAPGPRMSITFTLRRLGAARAGRAIEAERLDHRARLDIVADQVLLYGELERSLPAEFHEWARLTHALAGRSRKER